MCVLLAKRKADQLKSGPDPFERMPIIYERAAGGRGFDSNPIGVLDDDEEGVNIIDPNLPERPAGYGPIAALWPARQRWTTNLARAF